MVSEILVREVMTENYTTMSENEPLSKAITVFDEKEPDVIVVFDSEGNYKGILSERWIYRARLDPTKTKVGSLTRHVAKAYENESLVSVAKKMLESNVQAVPVFDRDEDQLVGIVSDVDLLFKVVEKEFGDLAVINFATTTLITLLPEDSVGKALATFRDHNISRAPIIEGGKVVGIVTMHDIVTRFLMPRERARYGDLKGEKIHPLSAPVKNIMSSPPIYVGVNGTVRDVVELMKEHDISSVLILDEKGKGIGIVTKKDLIEALVKYGEEEERKILIQFAGDYKDMDGFELEKIKKDVQHFAEKMEKMFEEGLITVHFKKIKDTRKESNRYSIRMRFITPGKAYNAHHEGFGALDVMQIVLDKMEREVIADKEKELDFERGKEYLEKYELWL